MKKLLLITLLFCSFAFALTSNAQDEVRLKEDLVVFNSANYDEKSGQISVFYSIKQGKALRNFDYSYNVELFYSIDDGKNFRSCKTVTGDVGTGIKPSFSMKAIKWSPLKDDPDFEGQNVVFSVRPTIQIANSRHTKGPEFGALNILFPGLGDIFVRPKSSGVVLGFFIGGLIGGSIYLNQQAQQKYNDYLNATTISDQDKNLEEANTYNLISQGMGYGAVAFWGIDILTGVAKGFKNKSLKNKYNNKVIEAGKTAYQPKKMRLELFTGYATNVGASQLGIRLGF